MKNFITLTIILLITNLTSAQCDETVTGFGNNTNIPAYNIDGDVNVVLNEDLVTLTLNLGDNFMTAAGPDIRAFIVNSDGLSDVQLTNTLIGNLENLEFGLVGDGSTSQNGAKSFTIDIPEGLELGNFDKIFFYCLQFNQFWDLGSFTPFTPSTCDIILGLDDTTNASFAITPNPANNVISIDGIGLNDSQIRIFNTLGKQVHQETLISNKEIDIQGLNSGLYLVSVTTNGRQTTQKLIVE